MFLCGFLVDISFNSFEYKYQGAQFLDRMVRLFSFAGNCQTVFTSAMNESSCCSTS